MDTDQNFAQQIFDFVFKIQFIQNSYILNAMYFA